jgi:hypothetical protein
MATNLKRQSRMSRRINVNPGQYKVAGRERQGDDIVASEHKAQLRTTEASRPKRPTTRKPAPRKRR